MKQFYKIILGSVSDGVFTVDNECCIMSFNSAAEKITGVCAEEAIGKRCREVFQANICDKGCALKQTMETGVEQHYIPAKIKDAEGCLVPISLSTAALYTEDGTISGAVETFRDLSSIIKLRKKIAQRYTYENMVGKSKVLQKIFAILPDIATSNSTVLIEGPSGSGKELMARAVHNLSTRRNEPFIVVNCGTLPSNLFESVLFGYIQGAFSDAKRNKPGRIALAEGGTVFFDEVSELPLTTQVKLLRVLQERGFEPLGGTRTRRADVRVVAATNKKLSSLVESGQFRDDLYFRLAVVRLNIPSLDERRLDIPFLVEHFIGRLNETRGKNISGVTPSVMEILMRHRFPGNVRELENLIEYGFVMCHNRHIDIHHLPEDVTASNPLHQDSFSGTRESKLQSAEADTIRDVLDRVEGQVSKAAKELGISRTTLWRKMKKHGISIP